jgi:hypothetical protein
VVIRLDLLTNLTHMVVLQSPHYIMEAGGNVFLAERGTRNE